MKKALVYLLLIFNLQTYATNLHKLPSEGTLCTEYVFKLVLISYGKQIPSVENKAIVYTSLNNENKTLIEFAERHLYVESIQDNIRQEKFTPSKQKITYFFDNDKLKVFEYLVPPTPSKELVKNRALILKETLNTFNNIKEYYNAKCFLLTGFYYFKENNITMADAISKKIQFPLIEKKETDSAIYLKSKTTTNDISASLDIKNNYPILREYSNTYIDTKDNCEIFKINTKFTGDIKIENTNIIIPKKLELTYIYPQTKTGFKINISILTCKYLKDFDFDKKAPKIYDKWKIKKI